jgi:hypothetical protein
MKQWIRHRNPFPKTNATLTTAIAEEWDDITSDEIAALVDSIPT